MRKSYLIVPVIALAMLYSTPGRSNAAAVPPAICFNSFIACTCGGPSNNHACYGADEIHPRQAVTHTATCPYAATAISGGYITFDADGDQNDEFAPEGLIFTIQQNNWEFSSSGEPIGWSVTLDNLSPTTAISEATCVLCCGFAVGNTTAPH